eukprot:g5276.t1
MCVSSVSNVWHLFGVKVLFVGVPLCQSFITGLASQKHIKNWYTKLKKPKWTPPNWLFPPMGTTLFICKGVASWLIWRKGGFTKQCVPLTLYGIQFVLTTLWTPLFFNVHKVKLALADAVVLNVATAATTYKFYEQSTMAGCLMTPFLCYCSFVVALTWKIAMDNPNADKIKDDDEPSTSTPPVPTPSSEPTSQVEETKKSE